MNRTKFYHTNIVNGNKEVDQLYNTLSLFEENHTPTYYRTTIHDNMQPDLISKRFYGTELYWWIICLVNKIENPFEDISVGMVLKIPSIYDIYDFYQKYGVR